MELEPSVVLFTLLALLLAAVVLRRKAGTAATSSTGSQTPKALPEPLSTLVSQPVKEEQSLTSTLFQSTKDSEPASVPDRLLESTRPVASQILPDMVSELVSVQETALDPEPVFSRVSVPEMVPQPGVIAKPAGALEPVLEALSELEPVSETAPQPEPVPEAVVALEPVPKIVPQLETAAHTFCIQEQVSKSTSELVLKQFSEAQASSDPETSSKPEPEMVCGLIPGSEPVSVSQVIQEDDPSSNPVSEPEPAVQSELEPEKVLKVVAEWVSGPVDVSELVSTSPKENPSTIGPEAAAKPEPEPEPEPEIKEVAASQEKLRFSPGKKQNKFETLMTKEEMEEEQRVQQEQLAAIFLLLRENQEALGEVTEGDMEEQLKLYSL
ncbi:protein TsetseEP-like isoform X2 [Dunckerocampus dactyliophorus]|uniref:protein TsetseEP-like isoform X2 n=1 Tax=Dunckerocampus dactyliophorus TaxID=161453 RepID=UPI0024067A61|nr:protein TsetseEP-like isoform X2 [Dunckerocampus dactyliophorus]